MADRILRVRYGDNVAPEARFKSVVKYLKELIEDGLRDEYVRRKAVSIVDRAGVKGHDELGEIRAIVKWVQNNVVYRKDPIDVEYFMTARRILKDVLMIMALTIRLVQNGLFQSVNFMYVMT